MSGKKLKVTSKIITRPNWVYIVFNGIGSLVLRFFCFIVIGCLLMGVAAFITWEQFGNTIASYYHTAKTDIANTSMSTFRSEETSYIYDSSGRSIAKLRADKDSLYLTSDQIPKEVKECFVSVEDRRFYDHFGIDLKSLAKAAYLLVRNKGNITRGGSTITQQLVKNVFLTQEVSYERKFKEIFYAIELEKKYTKDQILEFYINNIYFGNGYYGIGAAAKGYFNSSIGELSLAQIAYLCAIPNSPVYYDPIEKPEHTKERQKLILTDVQEIYPEEREKCLDALTEDIELQLPKQKFYNYEASYAIDCSVKFLMKLNGFSFKYSFETMEDYEEYNEVYAEAYNDAKVRLYSGGYKIYTTLDNSVQKELQTTVDDIMKFSTDTENGIYKLQAASTVIDNKTGKVIALVGGRSQKSISKNKVYTLNRAFQMHKQPGSTIKPLIVYTPSLMNGYKKSSIVNDRYFKGGPNNSNGRYSGSIPLSYAVEQSKNVVAWRLFSELGPKKGLSYVQKMGFSSIVPNDYYSAASLGGLTYGCSTVEMASGYFTLFNDGKYREPTCIKSVLNNSGFEIYSDSPEKTVYSAEAARTMTEILQGVIKNGTARGLAVNNMPAAAKTGTTNDQTNGWFCGYTPYYTVSVWVGTDGTETVKNLWGATYPGSIWKSIQDKLNNGLPTKEFAKVEDLNSTKTSEKQSTTQVTTEAATTEDSSKVVIDEIEKYLSQYNSLVISSNKDINKETTLYNKVSSLIAKLSDSKKRNHYNDLLSAAESKKSAEINDFLSEDDSIEDDEDSEDDNFEDEDIEVD